MKTAINLLIERAAGYKEQVDIAVKDLERHNATIKSKLTAAEENENIVNFLKEKCSEAGVAIGLTDGYGPLWQFEQAVKTNRLLASAAQGDAARAQHRLDHNQAALNEVEAALQVLKNQPT